MRLLVKNDVNMDVFCTELSKFGVECKLINDATVADRSLQKIHKWKQSMKNFDRLIDDFNPHAVLSGPGHLGMAALKSNIPFIAYLVGDVWREVEGAGRLHCQTFPKTWTHKRWKNVLLSSLEGSRIIFTVSKYLEKIVRERFPDKLIYTCDFGIDSTTWYSQTGISLQHPCVGLVQRATVWDKAKEMLVLKRVLVDLPDVTFYWAGNGRYVEKILKELQGYPNFKWLGALDYPDKVRQFLSEIDVYALLSGLDMTPRSLKQALVMEKPAIATNVGGVPEIMEDGKSGFLVEEGDYKGIVEKITYLFENKEDAKQMASYGKALTLKNFSWNSTTKKFISCVNSELNLS